LNQKQSDPHNNNPNPQTQYKPPTEAEMTEEIFSRLTLEEKEYYEAFTAIISKLKLQGNVKVVQDNSLSALIRTSMAFMSNWYMGTAFQDSNLVAMLPDTNAKREFVAFRKKYMNFPVDAQLAELKRLGHVKPKKS